MAWRWLLLLVLGLVVSTPALGQQPRKRVSQYEAEELSDEEAAARRANRKSKLIRFERDEAPPETPFPWRLVGLGVLVFAVTAPFAYATWRSASKELEATHKAFAPKRRITRKPPPPTAPTAPVDDE